MFNLGIKKTPVKVNGSRNDVSINYFLPNVKSFFQLFSGYFTGSRAGFRLSRLFPANAGVSRVAQGIFLGKEKAGQLPKRSHPV
jgi:hypothetical protein